jgi:hypothetical protein
MAHPLAELREHLLFRPDVADVLRIADNYLINIARMGSSFYLPLEHAEVKPILDYYAGDLKGWVKYIHGIRNMIGKQDARWPSMQELYRTVEIRLTQRDRRVRINAAIDCAVAKGLIESTTDSKRRYEKRCVQEWIKRRTLLLTTHMKSNPKGRLDEVSRAELLDEFWERIDQEIAEGKVPPP